MHSFSEMKSPSFQLDSFSSFLIFFVLAFVVYRFPCADGLLCVECGWNKGFTRDCGRPLPKPNRCRHDSENYCATQITTDKNGKQVDESHQCYKVDTVATPCKVNKEGNTVCTYTCKTDGCNADVVPDSLKCVHCGWRLENCPDPLPEPLKQCFHPYDKGCITEVQVTKDGREIISRGCSGRDKPARDCYDKDDGGTECQYICTTSGCNNSPNPGREDENDAGSAPKTTPSPSANGLLVWVAALAVTLVVLLS